MKFVNTHRILFYYSIIICIGLFLNVMSFFWLNSFNPEGLRLEASAFTNNDQNLSYRLISHEDDQRMTFSVHISEDELSFSDNEDYAIYIFQMNGQAYSVYFNGKLLGVVGDMETGNSNIWNSTGYFYFDNNLVKENNVLSIDIVSLYDRGLSIIPVYIMTPSELSHYLFYSKFFANDVYLLAIGFAIFSSIVVFMLYLMSSPKNKAFIYCALALFFLGLYLLDYTTFSHLPVNYLIYKKFVFGCLYVSVSMASLVMYHFYHRKLNLILAVVTILCYIPIIVFVNDMITFKMIYNYYNIFIILILLGWLITSIKYIKADEAKMFFLSSLFLLICTLIDIPITLSGRLFSLATPFFYSFILSMTSIILFFREFVNRDRQIKLVNDAQKKSYLASITDGMTGLYNHRYLLDMLRKTAPPYSAAMLDIDDFKGINDSYGHRFGDKMIQFVSQSLLDGVRSTDTVFRYGGDEFFVIFPFCTSENAEEVISKIQQKISQSSLNINGYEIRITLSGGVYYVSNNEDVASVLDRVDKRLYASKNAGKNRITTYSSLD